MMEPIVWTDSFKLALEIDVDLGLGTTYVGTSNRVATQPVIPEAVLDTSATMNIID